LQQGKNSEALYFDVEMRIAQPGKYVAAVLQEKEK